MLSIHAQFMSHHSLIVLRLSIFYKIEIASTSYYRLYWLDNGRGMVFLHSGWKEGIKQHFLTDGWIILFTENLYRIFLKQFQQAKDMLLFNRLTSQGFIEMDYQMLIRFNQYAADLKNLIDENSSIQLMQPILATMLFHTGHQFDQHNDIKTTSWIDQQFVQIDSLIQNHFREERSDTFYAESSGMNVSQLNNICRKLKGCTILSLVRLARLSTAKSELTTTSRSIKTIALELGFKTDSHFSNFFKRAIKMTPREYRVFNSKL